MSNPFAARQVPLMTVWLKPRSYCLRVQIELQSYISTPHSSRLVTRERYGILRCELPEFNDR
jgi:hypothetical protein